MNYIKWAQICFYSITSRGISHGLQNYLRHTYVVCSPFSTLKVLLWQQKSRFVGLCLHFHYNFSCQVNFQEVALNNHSDDKCWETWKFCQRVIKVTKLPIFSFMSTRGKVIKLKKEFIPSETVENHALWSWSCWKCLGQR